MATFKVVVAAEVQKDLRHISRMDRDRIIQRIKALAGNPRPAGSRKLKGRDLYRIRQGDYRILYEIRDKTLVVFVVRVGHRREVYRGE
ncbi:MAG: type II toxin-antitoxin system RelE/ParE family toxin [Candidatus Hydrogenedentes bacterium]|nr:type II toxin-antitoxin system RelE/ParE family toxin [Candidatus Hydrogenedentota bacterium]